MEFTSAAHFVEPDGNDIEEGELVKPSIISIPSVYTKQTNPTITSFEQVVIDDLRSINTTLNSMKKRLIILKTKLMLFMKWGQSEELCMLFILET